MQARPTPISCRMRWEGARWPSRRSISSTPHAARAMTALTAPRLSRLLMELISSARRAGFIASEPAYQIHARAARPVKLGNRELGAGNEKWASPGRRELERLLLLRAVDSAFRIPSPRLASRFSMKNTGATIVQASSMFSPSGRSPGAPEAAGREPFARPRGIPHFLRSFLGRFTTETRRPLRKDAPSATRTPCSVCY